MKQVEPTKPSSRKIAGLYMIMTTLFIITCTTLAQFIFFGLVSVAITYGVIKFMNRPRSQLKNASYYHDKWLKETLEKLEKHK